MAKVSDFLKVTQLGKSWYFPVNHIAENRTQYYLKVDPENTIYEEEFEASLNDWELIDWFENNMNPKDFEALNIKTEIQPTEPPDWPNYCSDADIERVIVNA